MEVIKQLEKNHMKKSVPFFEVGDTVDVHVRVVEGQKERVQVFSGVVIGRSGSGMRESFKVRRIMQGEGVERVFPLHAPSIVDIVPKKHSHVRRAKLYYLRERVGKAVRLKERRVDKRKERAASS